MGYTGKGDVPGVDTANAHSVHLTSPLAGAQAQHPCPAPQPTPPPEPKHPFCAQLTVAGLSFRRPRQLFSPSSRRALHPPAGGGSAPWPWHREEQGRPPGLAGPGGAQLPACSFGGDSHHEARRERLPRRISLKQAPRVLSLRRGLEAAVSVPLLPPHPVALRTRPEPEPASGASSWGEVQAGAEGGAGPGVPGKRKKTEERERNREARN